LFVRASGETQIRHKTEIPNSGQETPHRRPVQDVVATRSGLATAFRTWCTWDWAGRGQGDTAALSCCAEASSYNPAGAVASRCCPAGTAPSHLCPRRGVRHGRTNVGHGDYSGRFLVAVPLDPNPLAMDASCKRLSAPDLISPASWCKPAQ
jgi:hypothetical protein